MKCFAFNRTRKTKTGQKKKEEGLEKKEVFGRRRKGCSRLLLDQMLR